MNAQQYKKKTYNYNYNNNNSKIRLISNYIYSFLENDFNIDINNRAIDNYNGKLMYQFNKYIISEYLEQFHNNKSKICDFLISKLNKFMNNYNHYVVDCNIVQTKHMINFWNIEIHLSQR